MTPYDEPTKTLLRETGVTVRQWTETLRGRAWTESPDWGIVAPLPTTARRFAVFCHEVGHQVLHRHNGSAPRWREEIEAWEYALAQFDRFELALPPGVLRDAERAIVYAIDKALRAGASVDAMVEHPMAARWVADAIANHSTSRYNVGATISDAKEAMQA